MAFTRQEFEEKQERFMRHHKKRIYISGPMSGIPEFNFPAFFEAQKLLEAKGWEVFNPAEKDAEGTVPDDPAFASGDAPMLMANGFDFQGAFRWDLNHVLNANAIYMLKGWEHSPGARAEWETAVVMQLKYGKDKYEIIYE